VTARHLTASAAVIDPDADRVLLVWHRASGLWMLPGGHVDPGESPAEAALREVLEETGIVAEIVGGQVLLPGMSWQPSPIVTAEIPAPAKPERPGKPAEAAHTHVDLLFAAVADSAAPLSAALSEVAAVRWQPIDRLGELDVRAEVPVVVPLAVAAVAA
jgi:8-oxo-dGTP diphosphatase